MKSNSRTAASRTIPATTTARTQAAANGRPRTARRFGFNAGLAWGGFASSEAVYAQPGSGMGMILDPAMNFDKPRRGPYRGAA